MKFLWWTFSRMFIMMGIISNGGMCAYFVMSNRIDAVGVIIALWLLTSQSIAMMLYMVYIANEAKEGDKELKEKRLIIEEAEKIVRSK